MNVKALTLQMQQVTKKLNDLNARKKPTLDDLLEERKKLTWHIQGQQIKLEKLNKKINCYVSVY